jgi:hypothetical protein
LDERLLDRHDLQVGGRWAERSATERFALVSPSPEPVASFLELGSIGRLAA